MRLVQKRLIWIGMPIIAAVVIAIALVGSRRGTAESIPAAAAVAVPATIATLHRQPAAITEEAPGTVVAVQHAELAAKVMGRIAAVYVHEGDHVAAGQLLVRLEGQDLAANVQQAHAGVLNTEAVYQQAKTGYAMQQTQSSTAIQQAQSALAAAQAQLAKARQGPRPEQVLQADEAESRARAGYEQAVANLALVKDGARAQQKLQADQSILAAQQQVLQAEAGLATARAMLANAEADYRRMNALYVQDIIPKQRLDAVTTHLEAAQQAVQQANATVNQAKAGVEIVKAQASLVHEGARREEITSAEKQVEQAHAAYAQAKQEAIMAHQGGRWEDIKAAQEGVRQAEAGVRAAKAAQSRDQVSEKEIVRASAGIAQAKAGLSGAQTMLGYTAIYAPFSGVITARKADPGNMAMPQMPLLAMDDDSRYQLVSQVPERLATQLARNTPVTVQLDATEKSLPAVIAEIAPSADPASRTLTVKANLPRAAGVQSGLFGRLRVTAGTEMQLFLPIGAIVERKGLTGVYLVDATDTAQFTLVTLGKRGEDRAQVLSGLQDGQRVVAAQPERIASGQRISAEGGRR